MRGSSDRVLVTITRDPAHSEIVLVPRIVGLYVIITAFLYPAVLLYWLCRVVIEMLSHFGAIPWWFPIFALSFFLACGCVGFILVRDVLFSFFGTETLRIDADALLFSRHGPWRHESRRLRSDEIESVRFVPPDRFAAHSGARIDFEGTSIKIVAKGHKLVIARGIHEEDARRVIDTIVFHLPGVADLSPGSAAHER